MASQDGGSFGMLGNAMRKLRGDPTKRKSTPKKKQGKTAKQKKIDDDIRRKRAARAKARKEAGLSL